MIRSGFTAGIAKTLSRPSSSGTIPQFRANRRSTSFSGKRFFSQSSTAWTKVRQRPIEYLSIPCVAAFVGITTNWMGVKMLFYPIEYFGLDYRRWPDTPYGLWGWQGVVPCKTQIMAQRLVKIVTQRLLSLEEAFGRLDPQKLAMLLMPALEDAIRKDLGDAAWRTLQPVLPILLPRVLSHLQRDISMVLDLEYVVESAFLRDKVVLVDLFQKVGRVELEFLVNSGFGFGFLLGLGQMVLWARHPASWTLPAAGALVGYVTNWIAIKLLFEPAEPYPIAGPIVLQGLFESRQIEVSDEFGAFMEDRVLNSTALLRNLAANDDEGELFAFLRRELPWVPTPIRLAAVRAVARAADHPDRYPELHQYVREHLDISATLASRLKLLSPTDFEDLLHPVFQEDEITLIATGGVLGLAAGLLQTRLGWGGPQARTRALSTIGICLLSSALLYGHQKQEEAEDPPFVSTERPHLRRRPTILRVEE